MNHIRIIKPALLIRMIFFLSGLALVSCPRPINTIVRSVKADGQYDTEYPSANCAGELEKISQSIKLLNSIAYYKQYVFPDSAHIRYKEIERSTLNSPDNEINYFNNTASGTATLILSSQTTAALLTCAHIIDFPDTIIRYMKGNYPEKSYIKSIAYKEKQINYINDLPEGNEIELLVIDRENDIAIVGRHSSIITEDTRLQPVISCPIGKARDLHLGNFVYLMGFPRGNKMISSGLVSDPGRGRDGGFLVDTPFNRGFSGGIVLAIRDGVPNFELVGIAKSSAAEFEHVLRPAEQTDFAQYDMFTPYAGDVYIDNKASIQYGVTNIVPIETVIRIIKQKNRHLTLLGYDFSQFLNGK